MIEILKRGTKKKATCPNCGCLFSFDEEDVLRSCVDDIEKEWVNCPQCHEPIYMMLTRELGGQR